MGQEKLDFTRICSGQKPASMYLLRTNSPTGRKRAMRSKVWSVRCTDNDAATAAEERRGQAHQPVVVQGHHDRRSFSIANADHSGRQSGEPVVDMNDFRVKLANDAFHL